MILSANQPYFSPFPGFFRKALACDVLVILDEVQFPRGTTWISRNRFKNDRGALWITIPVWKKGLGLQRIDQVKICNEGRLRHKHLESIKAAYGHAPYFAEHLDFVTEIFSGCFERLIDLNMAIIKYLMKSLEIKTKIMLLSESGARGKGTGLLVEVCRALGAGTFLAQARAAKYLDPETFRKSGIELQYLLYRAPVYPQLWGDFIADLSAFDLVFTCGPKARDILLR